MTGARVDVAVDGALVRIAVAGDIDLANAESVEGEIVSAISNQAEAVSIDLSEVTYLDSVGLRLLFSLRSRLSTLQIALELVAPVGSPSRRVIELSGLDSLVPVHPPSD